VEFVMPGQKRVFAQVPRASTSLHPISKKDVGWPGQARV
jgi:hypothetical protein